MRTPMLAAILLLLAASSARAQPATAEGVDAFVRGDYQRSRRDPETDRRAITPAGFRCRLFMAAPATTPARGVATDAMRACALYMRAYHSIRGEPFR